MQSYKLVIFSRPVDGREAEYNDWYDNVHVGDVLAVPGFMACQRFKIANPEPSPKAFQYIAIYEIEASQPQEAMARLAERAGTPAMKISDALDSSTVGVFIVEPHGERRLKRS